MRLTQIVRNAAKISESVATPCSLPEVDMSDAEIMRWGRDTYGDKLPEKIAEVRVMIAEALAERELQRRAEEL